MYLVTGATGRVGRALVTQLASQGRRVRALSRQASAVAWPAGIEAVDADLTASDTLRTALEGVEAVFLFTPLAGAGELAALARAAGVRRGVLLSSIATQKADPRTNAIAARHAHAEQRLADSGLPATVLRPDTFAANALDWAPEIRASGRVRLAHPGSRRVPLHEQDLAAVAALAMTTPGHEGQAWWLTGPRQLSQAQQVQAIAVDEMPEAEALAQWQARMPEPAARRLLDYLRKSVDQPPPVSPEVQRLLGRPARDFSEWAADHRTAFAAQASV
jgi:uncharacterized protein YbjT (DUF2867 family)